MDGCLAWDPDARYLEERIKWAIREIIGQFGLTESDVDDLSQDLRLDLVRRLPKHQPGRAKRRTFASRLIANKVRTIIEERTAKKRDFRKVAYSLDEEINDGGGGVTTKGNLFRSDGRGTAEDKLLELRIDLHAILSPLPDQHQAICAGLLEGRLVTEIARGLKLSRSTIYSRLGEIRGRLAKAGYGPKNRPTH